MAFGYRRVFWLLFGIASFFFTLHLGLLLNVFFFPSSFFSAHCGLAAFPLTPLPVPQSTNPSSH